MASRRRGCRHRSRSRRESNFTSCACFSYGTAVFSRGRREDDCEHAGVSASGGWTVRGVTGTGFQRPSDGTRDPNRQFGWFVGWAERGASRVVFVRLVEDEGAERVPAGIRARDTLLAEFAGLAPRDVAR